MGVAAVVVGLLASIGPATQSVRDAIEFLWPVGVVCILGALCLLLLWERAQGSNKPAPPSSEEDVDGAPVPVDSGNSRERREAAYSAILSTSEAYINAHREVDALDYSGVDIPDLEAAETAVNHANQQFVTARQAVEQHGVKPVLGAVRDIEDSINKRDYDKAADIRRDHLVQAVRKDMNRPTAAFF